MVLIGGLLIVGIGIFMLGLVGIPETSWRQFLSGCFVHFSSCH
jgi:hypothetical protein